MTVSLSAQGMRRVVTSPFERDFCFEVGGHKYFCCKCQAVFASDAVHHLVVSDPTVSRFSIDVPDENREFENILSLINGESLSVNDFPAGYLISIANALGNSELFEAAQRLEPQELTLENAAEILQMRTQMCLSSDEVVSYIASHLHELEEEDVVSLFSRVGCDLSELILSSDDLVLRTEDSLMRVVIALGDEFHGLLGCVRCEYLSDDGIRLFIDHLDPSNMSMSVWKSITTRLSRHIKSTSSKRFAKVYDLQVFSFKGEPFNGIMAHLRAECDDNLELMGLITVTSSGDAVNKPHQLLDCNWNSYFEAKPGDRSWIEIDMKDMAVSIDRYSLRSHPASRNFLCSWAIEGSNDRESWIRLDARVTDELVGPSFVGTYPANFGGQFFRFIRIRLTGQASDGTYVLALSGWELFGTLKKIKLQ